jgi:C-methyltransferase C-terminal domain/Putative zinc binding domain
MGREVTMARCRACFGLDGDVVLDLGEQPASDYFPAREDPGPDPVYPLQMWLCASCGLAQLLTDPTVPAEPRGTEPAALVEQAVDAVIRVTAAGWLRPGMRVLEYGSPHGGSWLPLLVERGLTAESTGGQADVVLDCFGLMHEPDQAAALAERADRVAPGGSLMVQYHSLATILRRGQWNSLRHGHYGYYSTAALVAMLASSGFAARSAWQFDLYGGTVLLAATRLTDPWSRVDESMEALFNDEATVDVRTADGFRDLQRSVTRNAQAVHDWLAAEHASGGTVVGYGAASRAVALLCRAGVNRRLLPAVADASTAKQGRRMPGTDIPVIRPQQLVATQPDSVLLFLPDLLSEVRTLMPEVEAAGGRWVTAEELS